MYCLFEWHESDDRVLFLSGVHVCIVCAVGGTSIIGNIIHAVGSGGFGTGTLLAGGVFSRKSPRPIRVLGVCVWRGSMDNDIKSVRRGCVLVCGVGGGANTATACSRRPFLCNRLTS